MNFPAGFEHEMNRILGAEGFREYLNSFDAPRVYGLRVNTSKISVDDFLKISPFELKKIPWISNGFYYDGDNLSPAKHPYYYAGLYYLQEPSAMTPANLMPVEPGDRILDICAAPGGKSTELGAKLKAADQSSPDTPSGILVSNDISSTRARALLKNIEVFGIGSCMVTCEEPSVLADRFPLFFDKILIDAPCSGEGMFRKEHKMIRAWEEHGPEFFGRIQRSIINEAAKMLKKGGIIIYSTCTFSTYENEGTISDFLHEHKDFHTVDPATLPYGEYKSFGRGRPELYPDCPDELINAIRIWPQKMPGEGHFICILKKDEDPFIDPSTAKAVKPYGKKPEALIDASDTAFINLMEHISKRDLFIPDPHKEQLFLIPSYLPNLKGIRFLRSGLYAGDIKKGRFEPSQALAMTLEANDYDFTFNLKAEDIRVIKYLKGETIEAMELPQNARGFYLILLEGHPLGWAKANGNLLKNKYLPGWRITW